MFNSLDRLYFKVLMLEMATGEKGVGFIEPNITSRKPNAINVYMDDKIFINIDPVLILSISELDFRNNNDNYKSIIETINKKQAQYNIEKQHQEYLKRIQKNRDKRKQEMDIMMFNAINKRNE